MIAKPALAAVLGSAVLASVAGARPVAGPFVPFATAQAPPERILLTAERGGNWEVFSIAPDGTRLRNLTRHPAKDVHPAWSPDGRRVVFVRADDGLYIMDADGSNAHRIEAGGYFEWAKWSPDGRKISFLEPTSFSSLGWDGAYFRLHYVPADGGDPRPVADGANASSDAWSWSPDGTRIAFHRLDRNERMEIAIVDVDGGRARTLTNGEYPVWSRVGGRIAYTRSGGIHVIRPDGTARRRVTRGNDQDAAWSPDGRRLAFERQTRDGRSHVYIVDADGSPLRRLFTTSRGIAGPPVWSPDGRRVAWSLDYKIFIGRADGRGKPRRLTSGFVRGWTRVLGP